MYIKFYISFRMALILLNYFNSYNIQSFVLFILLSRIIDVYIHSNRAIYNLISIYFITSVPGIATIDDMVCVLYSMYVMCVPVMVCGVI